MMEKQAFWFRLVISDALRQAIERLLDDLDLRERMGRAGKNKFIEFQASTVVPRIEDVYYEVTQ